MSTNLILDQCLFMENCNQLQPCWPVLTPENRRQIDMYLGLMLEEVGETLEAANPGEAEEIAVLIAKLAMLAKVKIDYANQKAQAVELFDGLLDVTVVTLGAGISAGFPMLAGWNEVVRSNNAKVDPTTGKVTRRADGKVLKPPGWTPPQLARLLS